MHVTELGGGAGGERPGRLGGGGVEARDGGGDGSCVEGVEGATGLFGRVDDVGEGEAGYECGEDLEAGTDDPPRGVDNDGTVSVAESEVLLIVGHQVYGALDEVFRIVLWAVGADVVRTNNSLMRSCDGARMSERWTKDGLSKFDERNLPWRGVLWLTRVKIK